jgi:hypothetical protein
MCSKFQNQILNPFCQNLKKERRHSIQWVTNVLVERVEREREREVEWWFWVAVDSIGPPPLFSGYTHPHPLRQRH